MKLTQEEAYSNSKFSIVVNSQKDLRSDADIYSRIWEIGVLPLSYRVKKIKTYINDKIVSGGFVYLSARDIGDISRVNNSRIRVNFGQ